MKKKILQIVLIIIFIKSEFFLYNSLPIEKVLTFPNVKKNKNEYSYNIFLEKDLYKDKSNTILNEYL